MDFLDRALVCSDCGGEFVFTAGEQLFFFDKQFKNDPKRCKPCKGKRVVLVAARPGMSLVAAAAYRTETRTQCSACLVQTTVPFKPTQGRPVLCRECFQKRQPIAAKGSAGTAEHSKANAQMNTATAELVAAVSGSEHTGSAPIELLAANAGQG